MSQLKTVYPIALKLHISNKEVIKKSLDYLRLIQSKTKLNEITKITICLHLAGQQMGLDINQAQISKVTACTKSVYQKALHLVENLLNLKKLKTVHEICIQLSCEQANKAADKLYETYKKCDGIDRDFTHPQYAVMVVYVACRLNKVSVKKSDFLELSTLKPRQWTQLEAELMKFAKENGFESNALKKIANKKGSVMSRMIEGRSEEIENGNEDQCSTTYLVGTNAVESYEEWRTRILEEAYKSIC